MSVPIQGVRNACDMMGRAIKHIEQEIKAKELRIRTLKERRDKLQSQPNPDPAQIGEIEKDIKELEAKLELDRAQLDAFKEEFALHCESPQ